MTYYIIEIQTSNVTAAYLVTTRTDRYAAEAEYHRVLAAAAVSELPKHACALLTEDGKELMHQCYTHTQEAPAEVE